MSKILELFKASGALSGSNAAFIEDLYEEYLIAPENIDIQWRKRFDALRNTETKSEILRIGVGQNDWTERRHTPVRENFRRLAREPRRYQQTSHGEGMDPAAAEKQAAVLRLINAFRYRGHQVARVDPIQLREPMRIDDLNPATYGLTNEDMEQFFHTGSLFAPDRMKLRDILRLLEESYCGAVGSEFMYITETKQKRWIQARVEGYHARPEIDQADRINYLKMLTAAEGVERYLHQRYVGQKRFSLEGGDALIPALDELIQRAGRNGIEEIIIGMAHRGRLNVLTNTFGKPLDLIFEEFEDKSDNPRLAALNDVKYHLGFSNTVATPGGNIKLVLGFNPSHLEIIDPVTEGSVRARQRRYGDRTGGKVMPVLIHGDAAFAGQGVVMETFQLSQTRSYGTGGTVHIVVNNRIGFTTSNPLDARSSPYCTDAAKMVQSPVFHVNGDDPEAVIFVTRMALDFRNEFHKDVVIDIICYRRLGHNEADEPAVTQPKMYEKIRHHLTPRAVYEEQLIAEGVITREEAQEMSKQYRHAIAEGKLETRPTVATPDNERRVDWKRFVGQPWDQDIDTGVPLAEIQNLNANLLKVPENFELHPRVAKLWDERRKMGNGDILVNWGFAEIMAYATLLDAGIPVRLSGQDAGRGTFSHRHAKIHDQLTGDSYTPLNHLHARQGSFIAIDSILSEEAVLGYEYGFATAEPDALTIWEAQFGDFVNGAQVVIDQFISSAQAKWGLQCGLTMLLPHGMEGQGAEHSSARLERFLQLCANQNMQVCVPTTPAQIFHLLRRQMIRPYRTPLIVMSPKSLLRHPLATSSVNALTSGQFLNVIGETDNLDNSQVERVILCCGKVYYDLLEARRTRKQFNTAIVRIEQLYPFPHRQLAEVLAPYSQARELIWCQEEHQNQGAWDQIKHYFNRLLSPERRLYYVGRDTFAAPAVGHRALHVEQQERLIDTALSGNYDAHMNQRMQRQ